MLIVATDNMANGRSDGCSVPVDARTSLISSLSLLGV